MVESVVVDERERASGVPDSLSRLGIRVYFSKLDVGDYIVSPEIAVERKTIQDFVSSIYDSRLFYQAENIASSYLKPYLIVEGNNKELEEILQNKKVYYGAVASITLKYSINIVYTLNPEETAMMILELLRNSGKKYFSVTQKAQKSKSDFLNQVYLISAIPGIGRKLAERLLLRYGTPRRVFSLTTGELAMVKGIGWKRAERITKFLDSSYRKKEETGQLSLA